MESIAIRSLQHYLYCPHRWGLLEIDRVWSENFYVTRANLMHERVHQATEYTLRGRKKFTGVSVYHDLYKLYGVIDCIEGRPSSAGVSIVNESERYDLTIVEYKPTQPRGRLYNEEDLIQVFAQKICVDAVFHCDCNAELYYANTKKRVSLPLREHYASYLNILLETIKKIETSRLSGIIPPIRKGQKCQGCSLKGLCMPSSRSTVNVQKQIRKLIEDEQCENY